MPARAPKYFRTTASIFKTLGTAPEWRLRETDQADPVGSYRLQLTNDVLNLDRAATAEWATSTTHLSLDENSGRPSSP